MIFKITFLFKIFLRALAEISAGWGRAERQGRETMLRTQGRALWVVWEGSNL